MNNHQDHNTLAKSEYKIIEQTSAYLLLEHRSSKKKTFYKEFFAADLTPSEASIIHEDFHRRRNCKNPNLIELYSNFCSSNDPGESSGRKGISQYKYGMLYEHWTRDFDAEIRKRIGTTSYWSEEELLNTLEAILDGMSALHSCGIIHGDIKSKNIVVSTDGFVKLADQYVTSTVYKKGMAQMISDRESNLAPEVLLAFQKGGSAHSRKGSDSLNEDISALRNRSSPQAPNTVAKKNPQSTPFETVENDLWAVGLIFLEASILQSLRGIYDWEKGQVNHFLLMKKLEIMEAVYGKDKSLCRIIKLLLSKNPEQRKQALKLLSTGEQRPPLTGGPPSEAAYKNGSENGWGNFESNYQSIPSDVDEVRPLDKMANSFTAKIGFVSKKSFENLEEAIEPNGSGKALRTKSPVSSSQEEFVRQVREEILKREKSIQRLNLLLNSVSPPKEPQKKRPELSADYSKSAQAKMVSNYYFEETSDFNTGLFKINESSPLHRKKAAAKNGRSVDFSAQGPPPQVSIKRNKEIEINLLTFMESLAKMGSSNEGASKRPQEEACVSANRQADYCDKGSKNSSESAAVYKSFESYPHEADSPSFSNISSINKVPFNKNSTSRPKISPIGKVFEGHYVDKDLRDSQSTLNKSAENRSALSFYSPHKAKNSDVSQESSREKNIQARGKRCDQLEIEEQSAGLIHTNLWDKEKESFEGLGEVSPASSRNNGERSPEKCIMNRSLSPNSSGYSHFKASEISQNPVMNIPNVGPYSEQRQTKNQEHLSLIEKHKGEKIRKLIYENGDYYEGQTLGVTRQGYGTLFSKEGKIIFQGEWNKDRYHGYGILRNKHMVVKEDETCINFKDLNAERNSWFKYEGYFRDGHRHGIGTLVFFTKEIFKGEFEDGKASGKGLFIFANNEKVEGLWRLNKLEYLL